MTTLKNYVAKYTLIKEMLEAPDLIRKFDSKQVDSVFEKIGDAKLLMVTGEGSSRIFPAKNMIFRRLTGNCGPQVMSQSANDLIELCLDEYVILGASNSGRTKELVNLFMTTKAAGNKNTFGITCSENHALAELTREVVMLNTGKERAVAATKSVMIQALFYDFLLSKWTQKIPEKEMLADNVQNTLHAPFNPEIVKMLVDADHVFFAGKNNGVAEELALKTTETIRKNAAYFPGTYLLHGVEEVVSHKDVIVLVDDLPGHMEMIQRIYVDKIGARILAISSGSTPFPTITIPKCDAMSEPYLRLAAGWKILAETGIALAIDLDKPERARKIGNEY